MTQPIRELSGPIVPAVPLPPTTPSAIDTVHDEMVDLSMKIFIIGSKERQQERDDKSKPLEEPTITPPNHSMLKLELVKRALCAFAVVFNFNDSGDQVTASMLGEEAQGINTSRLVTVYVAKNRGTSTQNDNLLHEKLSSYFKERGAEDISLTDTRRIFELCSRRIKADIRNYKHERLVSAKEAFGLWGKKFAPREKIATKIAQLLGSILKCYSTPNIVEKQIDMREIQKIGTWVKSNGKELETTRQLLKVADHFFKNANIDNPIGSLDLLEDLCRLPRALEDLKSLKLELIKHQATLSIYLVKPQHPSPHSIDTEMGEKFNQFERNNRGIQLPPPPKVHPDIHCEIQLLTHYHTLPPEKQSGMWRYIACSKLPCFCCYHTLAEESTFKTEKSHGKVYWPWPVPEKLVNLARSQHNRLEMGNSGVAIALSALSQKLGGRIESARKTHSWKGAK
ncbi:hypothetical protein GGS24DRAFT_498559 [Hypoxylon argillaceum]|nr:hypothetical protein GGS24DRAFT_498559 [Hypoxylon argillaceum]